MADPNPLAQAIIASERRVARFAEGGDPDNLCVSCIRKRYGGPSCCDEGWDRWRGDRDTGGCLNWVGWDEGMAGPKPGISNG